MPEPDADARSLLDMVQQWAQRNLPAGGPDGHGGPECQWCPVCQFASLLRGENPEVAARLTEAGGALAAAVRALADPTTWRADGGGDTGSQPVRPSPRPRPKVQRIVLDGDPDHPDHPDRQADRP